jgi:hypothetical protein
MMYLVPKAELQIFDYDNLGIMQEEADLSGISAGDSPEFLANDATTMNIAALMNRDELDELILRVSEGRSLSERLSLQPATQEASGAADNSEAESALIPKVHLQIRQNPALRGLVEMLAWVPIAQSVSSAIRSGSRIPLSIVATTINEIMNAKCDAICGLGEEDREVLGAAICSTMMLHTRSIFSFVEKTNVSRTYRCIRRKVKRVSAEPLQKSSYSKASDVKCTCGFRVSFLAPTEKRSFMLVNPLKGNDEHEPAKPEDSAGPTTAGCTPFSVDEVLKNENYAKGVVTKELQTTISQQILRIKTNDASLSRANVRRQIEGVCKEFGIQSLPENIARRMEDELLVNAYGQGMAENATSLHSVDKMIEYLTEEKIPFRLYEREGVVEAMYWADAKLLGGKPVNARMAVHDTSFGIVDAKAGFEKFSVLATIQPDGQSQILVSGVSISDRIDFFTTMLEFLKDTYSAFANQPNLLMFSDEDRAFINATQSTLPNARTIVCSWHKKKNFVKARKAGKDDNGAKSKKAKPTTLE